MTYLPLTCTRVGVSLALEPPMPWTEKALAAGTEAASSSSVKYIDRVVPITDAVRSCVGGFTLPWTAISRASIWNIKGTEAPIQLIFAMLQPDAAPESSSSEFVKWILLPEVLPELLYHTTKYVVLGSRSMPPDVNGVILEVESYAPIASVPRIVPVGRGLVAVVAVSMRTVRVFRSAAVRSCVPTSTLVSVVAITVVAGGERLRPIPGEPVRCVPRLPRVAHQLLCGLRLGRRCRDQEKGEKQEREK